MIHRIILISIFALLIFARCGKETDKTYNTAITTQKEPPPPAHVTVEVIDGVQYVHNGEIPYSNVQLDSEMVIGDEKDGFYFGYPPSLIREDNKGDLYIDSGTGAVKSISKITRYGKFIKNIGSRGQGPGEFTVLKSMHILKDNRLWIFDNGQLRWQVYSPEGEYLFGNRVPFYGTIEVYNDILYGVRMEGFDVKETTIENFKSDFVYIIQKFDMQSHTIGYIGKKRKGFYSNPENFKGIKEDDSQFSNFWGATYSKIAIDNSGDVYMAYYFQNAIEVYKGDSLSIYIDRTMQVPEGVRIQNVSCCLDNKNNLYVLRMKPQSYEFWLEIFNQKGFLLHRIPIHGKLITAMYVGRDNKIYLADGLTYTITRYKAIIEPK